MVSGSDVGTSQRDRGEMKVVPLTWAGKAKALGKILVNQLTSPVKKKGAGKPIDLCWGIKMTQRVCLDCKKDVKKVL
jgi:hypothetical protein